MPIGSAGVSGSAAKAKGSSELFDLLSLIRDPDAYQQRMQELAAKIEEANEAERRLEVAGRIDDAWTEIRAKRDEMDEQLKKAHEESGKIVEQARASAEDILRRANQQRDKARQLEEAAQAKLDKVDEEIAAERAELQKYRDGVMADVAQRTKSLAGREANVERRKQQLKERAEELNAKGKAIEGLFDHMKEVLSEHAAEGPVDPEA